MKLLWRGLGTLLALPVLYLLLAVAGAIIPGGAANLQGAGTTRVLLASGPIHYDFLIPVTPEVRRRFGFANNAGVPVGHPDAAWLVVGWGAEAFYTTTGTLADISPNALARGVVGDRAVMHLDVAGPIADVSRLAGLDLNNAQFTALLDQFDSMFLGDRAGAPIPLEVAGHSGTDAFFAASGNFNLFNTCNVWVGQTLLNAGVPFGVWTPTPFAVRLALWWHGAKGPDGGQLSGISNAPHFITASSVGDPSRK